MPEIHCVYDFRDTPMRVRASFENRTEAEDWARAKFGEHGWVPPRETVELDLAQMCERIRDLETETEELSSKLDESQQELRDVSRRYRNEEESSRRLAEENRDLRSKLAHIAPAASRR
jgi:molecular chaperone GrpE (heat shock protein)